MTQMMIFLKDWSQSSLAYTYKTSPPYTVVRIQKPGCLISSLASFLTSLSELTKPLSRFIGHMHSLVQRLDESDWP